MDRDVGERIAKTGKIYNVINKTSLEKKLKEVKIEMQKRGTTLTERNKSKITVMVIGNKIFQEDRGKYKERHGQKRNSSGKTKSKTCNGGSEREAFEIARTPAKTGMGENCK